MHCIGELIEAIALWPGLRCCARMPVPRARHRRHHAVGADRDHAVDVAERDRRIAERARSVGVERRHDIADEGAVLRPLGAEARRLVAAPHDDVGGALDLLDLVAVDHALVAGEIDHPAAVRAQRLADREQHGVAEPAADQQHGLARRRLGRVAGRAHQHHRLAGRELRAQVGRAAHLEHDGRQQAAVAIDRGAGEREPLLGEPRAVGGVRQGLVVLQPIELPGLEGARRHRRPHHDLDDGRA